MPTLPKALPRRAVVCASQVLPATDVGHVADAVRYIAGLPLNANVLNMTIMASNMPFVGRG